MYPINSKSVKKTSVEKKCKVYVKFSKSLWRYVAKGAYQSLMVLAGVLVQSLSSSLVGFDLSIISRIRLLEVRLSVSFLTG